jgi:predicted metal-dependent peptidase
MERLKSLKFAITSIGLYYSDQLESPSICPILLHIHHQYYHTKRKLNMRVSKESINKAWDKMVTQGVASTATLSYTTSLASYLYQLENLEKMVSCRTKKLNQEEREKQPEKGNQRQISKLKSTKGKITKRTITKRNVAKKGVAERKASGRDGLGTTAE